MLEEEQPGLSGGITRSLRHLLEAATAFLTTKLELIGIELQEEKRRILELMILAVAAVLFFLLTLTIFSFSILALLWNTPYRLPALIIINLLYIIFTVVLGVRLQRKAALATKIFETTVEELKKDNEWTKRHL